MRLVLTLDQDDLALAIAVAISIVAISLALFWRPNPAALDANLHRSEAHSIKLKGLSGNERPNNSDGWS
jgi:hypothetical protein